MRLEALRKQYGQFTAVDDITLEVTPGQVFGILGPNGAGKTTTLRMITGMIEPSAGEIAIAGHRMSQEPRQAKALTGFIPDRPYVYDKLTAFEYLRFIAGLYHMDKKAAAERMRELLGLFELGEWGDSLIESFSHGMKQRLVFAGALLPEPKLLVVDEPMVGLDPKGHRLIKDLFVRLTQQEGMTILLSTHTLEVAEEVCEQIAIVNHGQIVARGTLAELRERSGQGEGSLEQVFLKLTQEEEAERAARVAHRFGRDDAEGRRRDDGHGGGSMIGELIGAKLRVVKGNITSSQEGRHRAPLFIGLSAIFAVMLFRGALWLVQEALQIQPVGELLVQKLISIAFLIFLGLLIFSNIVSAFSTFYLADDMEFLMGHPISSDALFGSRFLEAMTQSSWVIVLFGMPTFVALGVGLGASWGYYGMLLAVFLPFVAIPTGVATLIALAVTNLLVASRMRDAAMFMGLMGFALLFGLIRWMQPEKLLNPESFDSIGEMIQLLSTPQASFLPSDWAVNVLTPLLFQQRQFDWWSLGLLYTTPLALFFLSAWAHRRGFFHGYSRVQEGRHGESLLTAARDWFLQRSTQRGGGAQARIQALLEGDGGHFSALRQLIVKDRLIFTRDASQWSNILVIVALVIIYLVNYKYFEIASEANFFGEVGLYYFNLAACGFVVVALSGRFLFPAVSIEGRSFWMMMQAPISLEKMLAGKWLGAMAPVVLVGQFMIWASNLLVDQGWFFSITAGVVVLALSICIAGMAVGMGAIYPQFYNPNAASIAASFGALIFMILSIFLVLLSLFFSYAWISRMGRVLDGGEIWSFVAWDYVGLALALGVPAVATWLSLRLGARSLRRRM